MVINSGANAINLLGYGTGITGTTNTEYVYIPDANKIVHNPGGTLRLGQDRTVRIGPNAARLRQRHHQRLDSRRRQLGGPDAGGDAHRTSPT